MEVTYTPESGIRRPLTLFREMFRDALAARSLAWQLLTRDIRAAYRQSLLGIVWAFVPALVMTGAFTLATRSSILNVGQTDIPYPLFVLVGTALWQTFVEALNGPLAATGAARSIMSRVPFPREAILLSKLGEIAFNFGVKLILVLAALLWFRAAPGWGVLLAPVAILHLVMFGGAIGLLLTPIGCLYHDVSRALGLLVSFLFFVTPIVFPTPKEGLFAIVVGLNPVAVLLTAGRDTLTKGYLADPGSFFLICAATWLLVAAAWLLFRLTMPLVIERLSS